MMRQFFLPRLFSYKDIASHKWAPNELFNVVSVAKCERFILVWVSLLRLVKSWEIYLSLQRTCVLHCHKKAASSGAKCSKFGKFCKMWNSLTCTLYSLAITWASQYEANLIAKNCTANRPRIIHAAELKRRFIYIVASAEQSAVSMQWSVQLACSVLQRDVQSRRSVQFVQLQCGAATSGPCGCSSRRSEASNSRWRDTGQNAPQ